MKGFPGTLSLLAISACLMASSPAFAGPLPPDEPVLGDPTPSASNAIRAVFATRVLDSLEGFEIRVGLDVFEFEIPNLGPHAAAEVRAAPAPVKEIFEATVRDVLVQEAARVLPEADIRLTELSFDYGTDDLDTDPYRPALRIDGVLRADFTAAFFGLPPSTQTAPRDLARAFLYSGGVYSLTKDLQVPAGYDVVHIVGVPRFLELDGPGRAGQLQLEFRKNNFGSPDPAPVRLDFTVRLREGGVPRNVLDGPLVKAVFVVDDVTPLWQQAVPFMKGEYSGQLDLEIQVNSLDAELFGNYPLPRQMGLPQISADLLRIAMAEKLVQRADVKDFFEGLIRRSLENGFGPDVDLRFDWATFERSLATPPGGADGATVEPIVVRANAWLPIESSKMFVASSLGRLFSMTVGMNGGFELSNYGMWNADYTVAYPPGVHIDIEDSAGIVEHIQLGQREGFHVYLERGTTTDVSVSGRSDFEPVVFSMGVLELGLLLAGLWFGWRKVRSFRRVRSPAGAA